MGKHKLDPQIVRPRIAKVQAAMTKQGIDTLLLPVSAELTWLSGYSAMPLDTMTVLVVRPGGTPVLVAHELEVGNMEVPAGLYKVVPWKHGDNPACMVKEAMDSIVSRTVKKVAVGEGMKALHFLPLKDELPWLEDDNWQLPGELISQFRRTKDQTELKALQTVGACVDKDITNIQAGEIPLLGRTEREVSDDIERELKRAGHHRVGFALVAAGANAANPHHKSDDTVIKPGIVLFDIGGVRNFYRSDTTRCVHLGEIPSAVQTAYDVLMCAQEAAFQAVQPGVSAKEIDSVARRVLAEAQLDEYLIHGVGHGIGMDMHEVPFLNQGSEAVLQVGDVFSIEPGIYMAGQWGMRLEDIVALTEDGPIRLNHSARELLQVD